MDAHWTSLKCEEPCPHCTANVENYDWLFEDGSIITRHECNVCGELWEVAHWTGLSGTLNAQQAKCWLDKHHPKVFIEFETRSGKKQSVCIGFDEFDTLVSHYKAMRNIVPLPTPPDPPSHPNRSAYGDVSWIEPQGDE